MRLAHYSLILAHASRRAHLLQQRLQTLLRSRARVAKLLLSFLSTSSIQTHPFLGLRPRSFDPPGSKLNRLWHLRFRITATKQNIQKYCEKSRMVHIPL